jgi:CelD/BcsL family acetyltransferase involved in cellulose biosynthesis
MRLRPERDPTAGAPSSNLVVELAMGDEALEAIAPDWRRLHDGSTPLNPFLSYEWTLACRQASPAGTPFILTCRRDGRLTGLAPLYIRRQGPFRLLRFIGEWSSDYLGFLCASDTPDAESMLVDYLRRHRASWDLALLRPLCAAYGGALTCPVPDGLRTAEATGRPAPYLNLDGTWATLENAGGGQLRHTRRWVRKLEREGGRIEHLVGPEALLVFDDLVRIELRSWKARERFSWPASAAKRALFQQALATMRGVEVWLARLGGEAIGYLLNFVTPERVLFYQGAYDQAFRRLYPGGVLHYHAIRAAWESGRREYDFLQGDEQYKAGWTSARHEPRYLSLMPNTARGRAAFGALVAPRWFLRRFELAHTARALALGRWAAITRQRQPG